MNELTPGKSAPATSAATRAGPDPLQRYGRASARAEHADGYRTAALACVPKWLGVIGAAPWLRLAGAGADRMETGALLRHVSAATALGLCADIDNDQVGAANLHEHVRAVVTLWQSQLRVDGSAHYPKERNNPLHACIASRIAQWLAESGDIGTPLLLDDLDRHVQWLEATVFRATWLEAAMVATLADCAVVLRKAGMLRAAHHRLSRLLARQTVEGWFPEHGGVDLGLHSLTIDSLARVYHRHDWEELARPLGKAVRFLRHFVTPTGAIGACCSTVGTGFISPYGVELLAPTHAHAAAIATVLRRRFTRKTPTATATWSDDLAALLGPALVLASRNATERLTDDGIEPVPSRFITHFEQAKLIVAQTREYRAVVSMRQGGACWIWWSGSETMTEDPGVCAVFPHHVRSSGRVDGRNRYEMHGASVACGGVLRRIATRKARLHPSLGRWLRRLIRPRRTDADAGSPLRKALPLSADQRLALTHDYFRREVHFGEDQVEVADEVICRLPCQNVICGSAVVAEDHPLRDSMQSEPAYQPPLYLRGGRHVSVTRMYQNSRLEICRDKLVD